MTGPAAVNGSAFISYVREDSARVDDLQKQFVTAGIPVWRDTSSLSPGQDWRAMIRRAIRDDALAFIACFSTNSTSRHKSGQNAELVLAIDQIQQHQPYAQWLIPVRFDDCTIPDWDLGAGRTLASIHRVDLFGSHRKAATDGLVQTIKDILGI